MINDLIRNLKSLPNNPLELIIVIICLLFMIDFLMKGDIKVFTYTMKYAREIAKPASWQFIAIVILIVLWK